ncbi:hypothetical protein [Bdellovibrio sp. HCB209]|uniref:hypothetical protein n=1 Tax=Bdellovibrio sp. HCB209 TaxID=3394354 RepID=UPI0039B5B4F8
MKALSSLVLLSGLIFSGFAQATVVAEEAQNTFQLLRSVTRSYDLLKGEAADGRACALKISYNLINGNEGRVFVSLTSGNEDTLKDYANYSSSITKLDLFSANRIVLGDYGWEGEQTDFIIDRAPEALTVKAIYTYSERYGSGTKSESCTFSAK